MNLKKLSFLSASILCLNATIAEAKNPIAKPENRISRSATLEQKIAHAKKLALAATQQNALSFGSLAKTTATKSRVVAYAFRSLIGSTWRLQDTSKLYFSNPVRGGDLESDNILFDSAMSWSFNTTTSSLIRDYYTRQNFDAANNITSSLGMAWDQPSSLFENDERSFFTYTAAKKVATDSTQSWDGSKWENDSKRKVNYNAANQIVNDSNFEWDGSAWEISFVTTNTYSSSGKITKTTMSAPVLSPSPMVVFTTDYTYDASDFLTQSLNRSLGSSMTLVNESRTTFTNDASGNPLTEKVDTWTSGAWVNATQKLNQYDASKKLIVSVNQNWRAASSRFDTVNQNRYTYNGYGQLKTEMFDTLNRTTKKWDRNDSTIYYYEDHTPTSIKEIAQSYNVKVYPVPAHNELTIEANLESDQNVQISLLDIQGKVVFLADKVLSNQSTHKIPVDYLPSGNYLLQLNGAQGLKEVRQITIAH